MKAHRTAAESMPTFLVIVGETASGKSDLAVGVAEKLNGEIICADSRTVYKGMDIGTAKPSKEDQARIPHHLLDIVEPSSKFSAADFKTLALQAIDEITGRGKLPIMVGGTGLYVDSVLYDFGFSSMDAPRDSLNPRHLSPDQPRKHRTLRPLTLIVGLKTDQAELERRIHDRLEHMFEQGLADEVMKLAQQYGWDAPGLNGIGYREFQAHALGAQTLEDTKRLIEIANRQYAKRQRTWFKRNPDITWFESPGEAMSYIRSRLK